jgi:hypothetical protein
MGERWGQPVVLINRPRVMYIAAAKRAGAMRMKMVWAA